MDTFTHSGDVELDWEENKEVITIENDIVPRYCKISEIVDILTKDGESMNFLFLSIVLICLPSISSPSEFCSELLKKFTDNKTLEMAASKREQIQLKIMVILRAWARSLSVYCDFSGPVIENALDIAKEGIHSDFPTVIAAGKKVKAALKIIRDDLRDIEKAQTIFQNRVLKMRSVFVSNQTPVKTATGEVVSSPTRKGASDHIVWELGKIIDVNNNSNINSNSSGTNTNNWSSSHGNGLSYSADESLNQQHLSPALSYILEQQEFGDFGDRTLSGESSISFASVNLNLGHDIPSSFPYLTDELAGEEIESEGGLSSPINEAKEASELRNGLFENDSDTRKMGLRDSIHSPQYASSSPKSARKRMQPKLSIIQSMPFKELANFLTIYEYEDYVLSVRPREFIGMSWTRKELKSVHPDLGGSANLSRAIFYTNQTIAWVAREVIDYSAFFGPTQEAIEYFIRIAQIVLEKNNFNTFFHIVSALGLPAIRQLKAGWTHVASKKKQLFQSFLEICSSNDNYSKYRKTIANVRSLPHIPSIQVLIRDIVFLETSGPWRSGGIIDIKKALNLHNLIGSYVHIENGISQLCPYDVNIKNFGSDSSTTPAQSESQSQSQSPTPNPNPSNKIAGISLFSPPPDDSKSPPPPNLSSNNTTPAAEGSKINSNKNIIYAEESNSKENEFLSPAQGKTREKAKSVDIFSNVELHTPSFIYNLRVARDSFFGPLHEDYQNFDLNQRYSILSPEPSSSHPGTQKSSSPSPNPSFSPSRSPSTPQNKSLSKRTRIVNFFKRLVGATITSEFAIEGDDVNLAILQSHLSSINPDLNALWQDAKYADKVETRRLVGKLASAGLY